MATLAKLATAVSVAATLSSAGEQTDTGFDLRLTSRKGETKRTCFDTKVHAKGDYYIAGPAMFEAPEGGDWKFQAIFDGLGMVNKFELQPADKPHQVCYSSAWMNTGMYKEAMADPTKPPRGVLIEDTIPSRKRCLGDMCDYMAPNDNNWVNMAMVGDEAVWFSDTMVMVTMDPKTMNVTGHQSWANDKKQMTGQYLPDWVPQGSLGTGGSAHPLPRPNSNTLVEVLGVSTMLGTNARTEVYTFDASQKGLGTRKRLVSVPSDKPQYIHSFGVTPNYILLVFNMIDSGLGPLHRPIVMGSYHAHWRGIQVIDNSGSIRVFDDAKPFFHVHIANTFEDASGITFDTAIYDEIPFQRMAVMDLAMNRNKTLRDGSYPRGQMARIHVNLQTNKTTVTMLRDQGKKDYDFLKINPAYNGLPYCIYYAVEWYHNDKDYGSMAVLKHDICNNKTTYWAEADVYVNEPFFIANNANGEEDDGTLIFTANDGQKGKAIYVALDAKTFTEIERIELPNHLPFLAHGQFIPAKEEVVMV